MFFKILLLCLFPFCMFAQTTVEKLRDGMQDIDPEMKKHLCDALQEIAGTDTGKFLLAHVSPNLRIQAKPMVQLGLANSHDVITLEALRLNNTSFAGSTENQKRAKLCFTAEILSHELLHNAQYRAGLFSYPANFSGYEAALCEKLMELQAKYVGEKMFYTLRNLPKFNALVQAKPGLFLVSQRQAGNPEKMYTETLWLNSHKSSEGKVLYREQIREISQWNIIYTKQAFRNYYRLFAAGKPEAGNQAVVAHLTKIIRFVNMPVTAEFLLKNTPDRPIRNGIICQEAGKTVLKLIAKPQI